MYTLKSIAQRSVRLGAAVAILAAAVIPVAPVFAAELNPLTDRSLLLSSSAPGYIDTDGSGYSNAVPNPAAGGTVPGTYALAGTGPNGKKTGETFKFKTSTAGTIKAFTFQYCTGAAGKCKAPGNNAGDAATTSREENDTPGEGWDKQTSDLNITDGFTCGPGAGQFQITIASVVQSCTDWVFATDNKEDASHSLPKTGKNNYITLSNVSAATSIPGGTQVQIAFKPNETVFITNPGAGEFFVKLNTYNSHLTADHVAGGPANIDGGVTVANVMTDSIHITTKVLETMAFSVGTRNRDTLPLSTLNCGAAFSDADPGHTAAMAAGCEGASNVAHGPCLPISQVNNNRLSLGDPDAEYSLQTGKAWSVYSYWRLSSNSSGGATVYYSGDTLSNTVGDQIADMKSKETSLPGKEQFGLGFVTPDAPSADYTAAMPGRAIDSFPFRTLMSQSSGKFDAATLPVQPYTNEYGEAEGTNIGGTDSESHVSSDAAFKFNKDSSTVPEPIAQQNNQVISCATAKMRYVGNIAADTPAGVYTTKINYLAAPQY